MAFLSKAKGPGTFMSWASAPSTASTPRAAADGVCQGEATAQGFAGTYVAFVSVKAQYDAVCRAFGLDGTIASQRRL